MSMVRLKRNLFVRRRCSVGYYGSADRSDYPLISVLKEGDLFPYNGRYLDVSRLGIKIDGLLIRNVYINIRYIRQCSSLELLAIAAIYD